MWPEMSKNELRPVMLAAANFLSAALPTSADSAGKKATYQSEWLASAAQCCQRSHFSKRPDVKQRTPFRILPGSLLPTTGRGQGTLDSTYRPPKPSPRWNTP